MRLLQRFVLGVVLCISATLFLLSITLRRSTATALRHKLENPYSRKCISGQRGDEVKTTSCSIGSVLLGGVCVACPSGRFALPGWVACQPLLDCDAIGHEVTRKNLRYSLVHWQYYEADWNGYQVIYAKFNILAKTSIDYRTVQALSPSGNILHLIGSCNERSVTLFATNWTFMEVGSQLNSVFTKHPRCNQCMVRLHLSISYIRVLLQLHAMNATLCNSHSLSHLLSQFLVTDQYSLVLSAVDNLPQNTTGPIVCKHRELKGNFVAPEQRWPHGATKIFNLPEQPKYDWMSDIWKVPNVVAAILNTPACTAVMDYFIGIHLKCKAVDPRQRPTAAQLLVVYEYTWDALFT